MNIFWTLFAAFMLVCTGMSGDILRDLRNEINSINIALEGNNLTSRERDFLRGVSTGIFFAIELIESEGIK